MVNVIPPDHMDDVPVVESNQHGDVLVVPEPVLVDRDEDPKEEEFKEEEEPQEEEEDDMEVDIEEDENKPELTYPYKEVENTIESEAETIPASVHEVGESSTAPFLREDNDYLGNEVRSSVEQGTAAMEKLVEKLGSTEEEKAECKKSKKELEEARGFVFEERPNEAIDVPIEDEKSPSSKPRGSPHDSIMPTKSAPLTQAVIRRMIKESVDAAIAAEWARHANAGNDVRGYGLVRVKMPHLLFMSALLLEGKKVKFVAATLQGPAMTWWNYKVAPMGLETVNQMP
ncbi:hypothetical protein Tco_1540441 [Tanacetum coccineum]